MKPASQCAHLEKPLPVQTCELFPCDSQWFTTEWSAVREREREREGEKKGEREGWHESKREVNGQVDYRIQ